MKKKKRKKPKQRDFIYMAVIQSRPHMSLTPTKKDKIKKENKKQKQKGYED